MDTILNKQMSLDEIFNLTKETLMSDMLFGRLFLYRSETNEFDFLNLKHALFQKAKEFKKLTDFKEKYNLFEKQADILDRNKKQEQEQNNHFFAQQQKPNWLDQNSKINEVEFINEFISLENGEQKYFCVNGNMYDFNGFIDDEIIKNLIQKQISPYITKSLSDTTSRLFKALKTHCTISSPMPCQSQIHLTNGYYDLTYNNFHSDLIFTFNRLNVWYENTNNKPTMWLKYLSELLQEDDILTLQEYLGYCLIPCKKAQKALYIHGKGGEGKSIITSVLKDIFGSSSTIVNVKDVAEGSFTIATLEKKLLAIDDDAPTAGLKETGTFKTLVTSTEPIQVNPKGKTAYDTVIYARFVILSNAPLQTLYDRSEGVYRRQIILKTKDKPKDRIDDKELTDKILAEKNLIFNWCLEGLKRLINNGYNITQSKQSKDNIEELKKDSFNVLRYLEDTEVITFTGNPEDTVSTADLYNNYEFWCKNNSEIAHSTRNFSNYLKNYSSNYNIIFDYNIMSKGRRCRGFRGVKVNYGII